MMVCDRDWSQLFVACRAKPQKTCAVERPVIMDLKLSSKKVVKSLVFVIFIIFLLKSCKFDDLQYRMGAISQYQAIKYKSCVAY